MVMMVEGILRISRWLLESGYWSTVVFIQFISDHHVVDRPEIFDILVTCNMQHCHHSPCEYSNIYWILISTFVFQPPTVSVLSPRTGDTTITSQSCLGVNSVGKITPLQITHDHPPIVWQLRGQTLSCDWVFPVAESGSRWTPSSRNNIS